MPKKTVKPFNKKIVKGVYISENVVTILKRIAQKEHRSLSGQMSKILEDFVESARRS